MLFLCVDSTFVQCNRPYQWIWHLQFLANIIASKKLLIAQLAMLCGVDCNKTYGIRPKMPRKRPMNRAYWWGWNLAPFFCCQEECHVIWQVSDWSDTVVLSDTCQVKWRSSWQQKIGALDLLTPRLIVWNKTYFFSQMLELGLILRSLFGIGPK